METSNYWKLFESTGQVEDYLAFKPVSYTHLTLPTIA